MRPYALSNRLVRRRSILYQPIKRRQIFSTPASRKELHTVSEIEDFLSNPTWSVRSLLPTEEQISESTEVTKEQLHHLLRLSALSLPETPEEEAKMLRDLRGQLHFVQEVQRVDTEGVEPMKTLREESAAADDAEAIGLDTLRVALSQEETVGSYYKRIRRRHVTPLDAIQSENWDVLAQAPKKVGRFFVVNATES